MEFYSFSFGETKVVEVDADTPKIVAVGLQFGFKTADTHTVQTVDVKVALPHDPERTMGRIEEDAYRRAAELLRAAADIAAARTAKALAEESAHQVIVANRGKG